MKASIPYLFLSLVLACAARAPEWIHGSSGRYPFDRYMTGVGRGQSEDGARDSARAEIAKIFKTYIASTTQVYTKALQVLSDKGQSETMSTALDEVTKASTDKTLEGVIVAETFEQGGVWYALAVLDRAKMRNSLMQRISNLDDEVGKLVVGAEATSDKVQRIKALKKAITLMLQREAANSEYAIVTKAGVGMPTELTLESLTGKLETMLYQDFIIAVEVTGDEAETIRAALVEGLTGAGFVVDTSGKGGDLLVKGTVSIEKADRPDPTYVYVRFQSDFALISVKDQKTLGSVVDSGREGHLTLAEARQKALNAIITKTSGEMAERLGAFVFGEGR
ncbi:MAG: hypothetical protein A2284_05695 [Deltaproteobacteria bacterium RIFOXYA12_FULL_61_11]|nr:MAG: hypothetical protein A2284_05695 [Deltaproteobacteria bacterium RIFOXYA12_FULL_61_11]